MTKKILGAALDRMVLYIVAMAGVLLIEGLPPGTGLVLFMIAATDARAGRRAERWSEALAITAESIREGEE